MKQDKNKKIKWSKPEYEYNDSEVEELIGVCGAINKNLIKIGKLLEKTLNN